MEVSAVTAIIKVLEKVTGVKGDNKASRQEYLLSLVKATSEMPDDQWDKLPDNVQDWCNIAVAAVKDDKEIPDPEPSKTAKSTEKPEAQEAAPVATEAAAATNAATNNEPSPKSRTGDADKFRRAYVLGLVKGQPVTPNSVLKSEQLVLTPNYAFGIAYEDRRVVDILRKEGLLKK
jgi:hypothetical protein